MLCNEEMRKSILSRLQGYRYELRQGGALRCYTPESVADYIEEKHLYGY